MKSFSQKKKGHFLAETTKRKQQEKKAISFKFFYATISKRFIKTKQICRIFKGAFNYFLNIKKLL